MRKLRINPELEHLVEVAVIQTSGPIHTYQTTTHQSFDSARIECFHEFAKITLFVSTPSQIIEESFYWHIGDRIKMIERHTVACL